MKEKKEDFRYKILEMVSEKLEENEINDMDIYCLVCDLVGLFDKVDRPFWIKKIMEYLITELYTYCAPLE